MYKVSDKYRDFLENNLGFSPKTKIIVDGITYDSKFIKATPKIKHQNKSMFGGFPTKTCSFEIYDLNNELDFVNKEISIYRGLVIDGEIEYIPQGVFIATEDKITTNISKKTISFNDIQDKTQLFDSKYESSLDWSIDHTGLEIIQEICDKLNVELENTTFNLSDYSFKQPNFNESITNRQVVNSFTEIAGSIAFFNRTGKLEIKSSTPTNQVIPRKRYTNLTREKEFIINTLVLGKKGVNDDIVYPKTISAERKEWKIFDNPFVDLYRQEMIEELSKNFIGKSIIPFELEDFVDGFLFDLNDEISIIDKNGNIFKSIILCYESTSRIKSKISADTQLENKTDYNLAGSSKSNYNDIKLSVDHLNKQIQAHAESIETNEKSLEELKNNVADLAISADSINATVSETVDNMNAQETRMAELEAKASGLDITVKETRQTVESLGNLSDRVGSLEESDKTMLDSLNGTKADLESMRYSFTSKALKIGSEGDDNYSLYNNKGVHIYSRSALEAIYNKNGSGMRKLIITESAQFQNLKMSSDNVTSKHFSGSRKGIKGYYIDDLIQTLEDLEE